MQATVQDAYRLFHQGSLALAEVEANGIRIDVDLLDSTIKDVSKRIIETERELREDKVYQVWRKKYGERTNFGSDDQLTTILFHVLELPYPGGFTPTGRYKADKETLSHVDHPFVKKRLELERLKDIKSKSLEGLKRETVDGFFHPVFNLHTARTFRSSSGASDKEEGGRDYNAQNIQVRDREVSEMVRNCFVSRKGQRLIEIDFSAVEVRVACCYHKDPTMLEYIKDPSKDMHRDQAIQCYILDEKKIPKEWWKDKSKGSGAQVRYTAKNQFVFPQFYGDYYLPCAMHLWESIDVMGLKTHEGVLMKEHLKSKGIKELGRCDPKYRPTSGTFEFHMKSVEDDFWKRRFHVYDDWKDTWWKQYKKNGYFQMLTGFICKGLYGKNEVTNYPVQGCLAGYSKVLTKEGPIPIKDLVGKKVEVWTGFEWSEAVGLDRGRCKRARIYLSSGLTIECDIRHKLKNELDQWVPFDVLKVGDNVALPFVQDPIKPTQEITWPFVFGFIIGDGHLSGRESVHIYGGEKKKPILEKIYKFLISQGYKKEQYGGVHWKTKKRGEGRKDINVIRIGNKNFNQFLREAGFDFSWRSHTKRIPDSVWRMSQQEKRDFMEGLWLSDGSRSKSTEKNLHMCNRELLQEVQILISSLGFDSWICETSNGYLLRVSWREFNTKSHRKYPATSLQKKVKSVDRINYEVSNEWITDRRNFKLGKDVSQFVAERIIRKNSNEKEIYRFDKIVQIEILDYEETTYTMSVNDSLHQFVADGVIHKNTAFHCLLWSLIQLQKYIRKNKLKTKIISEVHDSILLDSPEEEIQEVISVAHRIMTKDIRKEWEWLIVPLEVEVEVSGMDESWHKKALYIKRESIWQKA